MSSPAIQSQLSLFDAPFDNQLDHSNRWFILANKLPWSKLADICSPYLAANKSTRRINTRMLIAVLIIQNKFSLSNQETLKLISESPYLQHFCGIASFQSELPFSTELLTAAFDLMGTEAFDDFQMQLVQAVNDLDLIGPFPQKHINVEPDQKKALNVAEWDNLSLPLFAPELNVALSPWELEDKQQEYSLIALAFLSAPIAWWFLSHWMPIQWNQLSLNTLASWLVIGFLYPVIEEICFRKGLQGALSEHEWARYHWFDITLANFLVSLLFGLLHALMANNLLQLSVFFPSLIFGFFRDRYLNIRISTTLHVFYNLGWLALFYAF